MEAFEFGVCVRLAIKLYMSPTNPVDLEQSYTWDDSVIRDQTPPGSSSDHLVWVRSKKTGNCGTKTLGPQAHVEPENQGTQFFQFGMMEVLWDIQVWCGVK